MISLDRPHFVGPEEFGIIRPTLIDGPLDRLEFYQDSTRNTLEEAEKQRQIWADRGVEALIVVRQARFYPTKV